MDLSLSLGFIKKPIDWVMKKLFLNAYQESDQYYWQHHAIGSAWRKLGTLIEYDTHLATVFSNDTPPLCYIALRASTSTNYKFLTLNFEAKGSYVSYQDTIVVQNIGCTPIIKSLPSIPLKSMWVARGGIELPYKSVHIKVVELFDDEGVNVLEGKNIEEHFNPNYTEILNSEFVKRWDYYWNVDEINLQKRSIKEHLYMKFLFLEGQFWRPVNKFSYRRAIFWLLTNKLSLSISFWSRNLVHGNQIRDAIKLQADKRSCSTKIEDIA